MQKGLTIIYWGYGKGKTTAAIGAALRALGQGQRVLFMQFMKGEEWKTGEVKMFEWLEKLPSPQPSPALTLPSPSGRGDGGEGAMFEFHIVGKGWVKIKGDKKPIEEHKDAAQEGLEFVKRQFVIGGSSGSSASITTEAELPECQWDLVILDEILSAVDAGLLKINDIKEFIKIKPAETHLIMTGHKEYPELVELADVVTKMEKIKHPFDKGILAQKGVDF